MPGRREALCSFSPLYPGLILSGGEKENLKIAHPAEPAGTDVTESMILSVGNGLASGAAC